MQLRRPPLIVYEISPNGDLRRCLHKCRQYVYELSSKGFSIEKMDDISSIPQVNENFVFTFKRLIRLAIQICLGMEYLASRQLIHGDLASRNVFLTTKSSIKIGDYGLCRKESDSTMLSTFIMTDNRARWAAPEILQREYQCLSSDVWSFGILLYELITLGAIPYHNISNTSELAKMLNDGYRLSKPTFCPIQFYNIMNTCWIQHSSDRPSFPFLTNSLTDFYDSIDTKDNEANFYVTPDPKREIYTLPLIKSSTLDSPATNVPPPSFNSIIGGESQSSTPKLQDSPSLPSNSRCKNSRGNGLVAKAVTNAAKTSVEKKEQLIHETERLLGFS
uniref:receptor protein-tyrosine kinase n=1 Tax=Panagrolaimus superbus TaxID=310955 RepID=A0A914YSA0_9BILA